MKQSERKNNSTSLRGKDGFDQYYRNLYGDRWDLLKKAFAEPNQSVEYKIEGAEKSYFLDSASIFAASCLPVEGVESILDLCAAPGGKTLVLASRMDGQTKLFSNERSPERKKRLATVVQTCLPEQISSRIEVSCSDGAKWCTKKTECFERILLDAPCSSERHVIADPKYLNQWSPSRIKTVTTEQWALLSCAFRLLVPGGILLYSTCALCPEENDGMIERLTKKFSSSAFSLLEPVPDTSIIGKCTSLNPHLEFPGFEKTQYGYMILPDNQKGAGPIYFSIIRKNYI